jgi:RNA polymerase sigma-32 factor
MPEAQEELRLAHRWREHHDRDAAARFVSSHLRLVVKIASR